MDTPITAPADRTEACLQHVQRLQRRSRSGRAPLSPDGLWIAITGNCNFRCVGCWFEALFTKTYVSLGEVRTMLQGSRDRSYAYISFTSGESFLHPQLCDIIEICRKPFRLVRSGGKHREQLCCYMAEEAFDIAAERYGLGFDTPPEAVEVCNPPAFWRFRLDMATGNAGDLCGQCKQARTFRWRGGK